MTRDIATLTEWTRVVLVVTAVCTTAVPIMFSLSRWWVKPLGRAFMVQAISFAVAVDVNLLFTVWRPKDVLILFWIHLGLLSAIAASTAGLAFLIFRMNFKRKDPYMLLDDKFYQFLKKMVQIGLPGTSTLYFTLAQIWDLPNAEEVVGTIAAFSVFFGLVLGVSTKTYNRTEAKYDGTIDVIINDEGTKTFSLNVNKDPDVLDQQDQILFKVNK